MLWLNIKMEKYEKGNNSIFYKNGTFYKDIDFNF